MKFCRVCKIEQPLINFNKNKNYKDGLNAKCKSCRKNEYKSPEAINKSKNRARVWNRWKWSGFTEEEFNNKLKLQNNKCAICFTDNPNHADHNHITKVKRGILCKKCNSGIAYLNEDIIMLENAIKYLNHYSR